MDMSQTMSMSHADGAAKENSESPYKKLFWVSLLHFVIMYSVMFTMVDRASSIYLNLNNLYMTGMMLAPMVLLMPLTMSMMYPNRKLNVWIYSSTVVVFVAFYVFMRSQSFIGNKEFVRSMIPHHSGAVLMCNEAQITDSELKSLCAQIIEGQTKEIDQMKAILKRL